MFLQDIPGIVGFKELFPGVPQNSVLDANVPDFSKSQKYITDNAYEHSYTPTVEENTYVSRTAISQLLTGKNRRGRCVD
jgi:hypothetical protein